MNELSMVYGMGLAALLFLLGFVGVVIRRNTLFADVPGNHDELGRPGLHRGRRPLGRA